MCHHMFAHESQTDGTRGGGVCARRRRCAAERRLMAEKRFSVVCARSSSAQCFLWGRGEPERTGPEKHETWTCLTAGKETGSGFLHNVAISDSSVATQTVTDGWPTSQTPDALTCVSACLCGTDGQRRGEEKLTIYVVCRLTLHHL